MYYGRSEQALFCGRVPRAVVLLLALVFFCSVPPEALARGPALCVWDRLLHRAACPACGSTRALAAFFHGHLRDALAFNHNVLVTAPVLLGLLAADVFYAVQALTRTIKAEKKTSTRRSRRLHGDDGQA